MRNLSVAFFLSLLIAACGPNYLYEETHPVAAEGWTYADTVDFALTIEDTSAVYNIYLEVEHTVDYAYQNLYARIYTRFPDGERRGKTISLELADKTGAWQGDCRGETCRFLAPIQLNAFFNEPGPYVFTLEQYMRESPVAGVKSIGFKLEEVETQR